MIEDQLVNYKGHAIMVYPDTEDIPHVQREVLAPYPSIRLFDGTRNRCLGRWCGTPWPYGTTGLIRFLAREALFERGASAEKLDAVDSMPLDEAEKIAERAYYTLPVYVYSHSGVTFSLTPFSCPWDSGVGGWFVVDKKRFLQEIRRSRWTPKTADLAVDACKCILATLQAVARGEVYRYEVRRLVVVDDEFTPPVDDEVWAAGELVDSCWGYLSSDEALADAKASVDAQLASYSK